MNILYLTNNEITKPLYDWLKLDMREHVLLYDEKLTAAFAQEVRPDLIISYNYRHKIGEDVLAVAHNRAINLHVSLLPWNRGAHPNFWSFMEDTPKGVTVHVVDKGIDTGEILLQKELSFDERVETLQTSYAKLHCQIQHLFMSHWTELRDNKIMPVRQNESGSCHTMKDFMQIFPFLGEDIWIIPVQIVKSRYQAHRVMNR